MKPVAEVAEAMYQAAREKSPAKTPETLFDLNPATQSRYIMLAEAAQGMLADSYPTELLNRLAEHLAWKLLNPQQFSDGVRAVLDRYAQEVGEGNVPPIVAKAIAEL